MEVHKNLLMDLFPHFASRLLPSLTGTGGRRRGKRVRMTDRVAVHRKVETMITMYHLHSIRARRARVCAHTGGTPGSLHGFRPLVALSTAWRLLTRARAA